MILATRDPFGFDRTFHHATHPAFADSIHHLLREHDLGPALPDRDAIAGFLTGRRLGGRTLLRDVLALPPGHRLLHSATGLRVEPVADAIDRGDLRQRLQASLQQALASGRHAALALSGGLDSALLLALLAEAGAGALPVYILAVDLPGYNELDAALDTATRLGYRATVVEVGGDAFIDALPDAIAQVEEPLFNLHPVAKLLLARAMRRDGVEVAISGDGADQVINRDRSANYLPLCNALFRAAGVQLHAPFLDPHVVSHLLALPPDRDKPCLRELAAGLGLQTRLVRGPKHSRLTPPLPLGSLMDRRRIELLSQRLAMPAPSLRDPAEQVLWTTLLLALDHLGARD